MKDKLDTVLSKLVSSIEGVEDEREMLLRLIIGLAVFLVFTAFRKQISKAIVLFCNKTVARKSVKAQNSLRESLTNPLSFFILILGIYISSEVIAPTGEVRSQILVLLKLGVIISIAWFAISFINSDFSFILSGDDSNTKKTAVNFISNFAKIIIGTVAALLVLEQFGISATKIFAALGIGGVAVAFACKDAVENLLSGFIIIFSKPFEVDDSISIDGEIGTVEEIKIRTTRLRMVDGSEKVYPNTTIANAAVVNFSKMEKRSFNETLWINYKHSGDEVEKFCNDLKELLIGYDEVIKDDVRVNFVDYGTHALEINIFFYVTTVNYSDYQSLKSRINSDIKSFADSTDIELAFSSQTVYFGDKLTVEK